MRGKPSSKKPKEGARRWRKSKKGSLSKRKSVTRETISDGTTTVKAKQAKEENLEREMANIAQKRTLRLNRRDIAQEEHYVSGDEEEIEFTKETPSTHIKNLLKNEEAQRGKESGTR